MEFVAASDLLSRKPADILVIPFWKGKNKPEFAAELGTVASPFTSHAALEDFSGKEGELLFLYVDKQPEKRVAFLGLGDKGKSTVEKLRRAYGALTKQCISKKIRKLNVVMPQISSLSEEQLVKGVTEGILLANYVFEKLKHDTIREEPTLLLQHVCFLPLTKEGLKTAKKFLAVAEGVYFARDLINSNADEVTPQYLVEAAKKIAKTSPNITATIFDKKKIEQEKMGLLLAVNRGSALDPAFIVLDYKGNPKSKERTVIVGKGITYDTGGLNLKSSGMETMKCDMSGAAAGLGTLIAAVALGLKVNFAVVIPTTENCLGSKSYKPGDVYVSHAGKTVEIDNTDAEGRLILADALSYVIKKMKPTRIIDFATLTGSIGIALGSEATGFFCNDDALADALIRSGSETFERLWRMPLYEEYKTQLKSDVADIRNTGGRPAGSITAALFLQEFVGDTPWAHCDIASTAFLPEAKRYLPKHATGVGIRLLIDFFEHQ